MAGAFSDQGNAGTAAPWIRGGGAHPDAIRCDVMRPAELGPAELNKWHEFMLADPSLQRAFLAPAFARACNEAHGRAYVGVLHHRGDIVAFLPFQFASRWHEQIRLAERIGGNLCDAAGLIARAGVSLRAAQLMRLCRLAVLDVSHLVEGQDRFGLDAEWSQVGYQTEIRQGAAVFLADLLRRDRILVRDTQRRFRKAERSYGTIRLETSHRVPEATVDAVIRLKREQYRRTVVPDAFEREAPRRVLSALRGAPADGCQLAVAQLIAGDRVLAQHLGLQHYDVLSHWFPVYDPAAAAVSPGRLLLWRMIEHAQQDGIGLIDYGEGDALYKREMATGSVRMGRANWQSGTFGSMAVRAWQSGGWRLARWRRRMAGRGKTNDRT